VSWLTAFYEWLAASFMIGVKKGILWDFQFCKQTQKKGEIGVRQGIPLGFPFPKQV
jgi:hypothetical protein